MKNDNSTKQSNASKPMLVNRFSHTLENCLFAKQELLKDGFSEEEDEDKMIEFFLREGI
jgi:hypothetical protein